MDWLRTTPGTRRAALTRSALTTIFGPGISVIGIGVAGANIFLVLAAAPPLYLLWVFVVDLLTLVRGVFGPVDYVERPRFKWFFAAGFAVLVLWAFLHLTPIGRHWIGLR